MNKNNIIYDGLNLFIGLQGFGKSYVCTHKAVLELINPKHKRKVLSNYPIIFTVYPSRIQNFINLLNTKIIITHPKSSYIRVLKKKEIKIILPKPLVEKKYSSYVWKKEYTSSSIRDALIIIDEGHDDYTGSFAWELTKDDRQFFSRLRHNNIAVYIISQSYENIHPFLRRVIAYIHDISKKKFPFSKTPSSFIINTYTSIKDYLKRDDYKLHKKARRTLYKKERIPFSLLVGTAYKTHQYRNTLPEPQLTTWMDELNPDIFIEATNPNPIPKESINTQIIKDAIGALIRLYKWKKRDATLEINKIILEYELSEINTTEKLIRKALARRAEILEDKDEIEDDI